jgi:hypothetical protein
MRLFLPHKISSSTSHLRKKHTIEASQRAE